MKELVAGDLAIANAILWNRPEFTAGTPTAVAPIPLDKLRNKICCLLFVQKREFNNFTQYAYVLIPDGKLGKIGWVELHCLTKT